MKKMLLSLLLAVTTMTVSNAKTLINGLYYNFNGSNATVTYKSDVQTENADYVSGDIVIPNQVTYNSVTYTVKAIGSNAFTGCSSLETVTIQDADISIGYRAFAECSALTSITNLNGTTQLSNNVFHNIRNLVTADLNITVMGVQDFDGCIKLQNVSLAEGLTEIGNFSFRSCAQLAAINIPSTVTRIGSNAFYNCFLIQAVTLPAGLTEIGDYAFNSCAGLSSLKCLAMTPPTCGAYPFGNTHIVSYNDPVYVPATAVTAYQGATVWQDLNISGLSMYTIQWLNFNDTVLATTQVMAGEMPVYPLGTPYKAPTNEYIYTFQSWTPAIAVASANVSYKATYIESTRYYTIRFLDEDATTVLYERNYAYGDAPQYGGSIPTKEPEACCNHPFVGWNPSLITYGNVTKDQDFVAVYGSETRQYTVTFQIDPEHILQTGLWNYGVTPTYNGETPTQDNKQFIGWSPEISQVNGDAVYTAVFNDTYQITLANCEHGSISVAETGIDLNAVVAGTVLHFNALPDEGYELDAWSGCNADGSLTVTANTTVSASFKKQTFVVTLVAEHGHIDVENEGIDLNAVEYGTALNLTPVPDEGYYFSHWHATACGADFINSNTTITAYFEIRTFQVIFVDYDNRELSAQTVNYGEAAVAPADPEREGYRFIGWDQDFSSVKANMTIMAQYEQLPTGFESVFSGENAAKVLRNGQIFILRGEKMYTLQGVEVK